MALTDAKQLLSSSLYAYPHLLHLKLCSKAPGLAPRVLQVGWFLGVFSLMCFPVIKGQRFAGGWGVNLATETFLGLAGKLPLSASSGSQSSSGGPIGAEGPRGRVPVWGDAPGLGRFSNLCCSVNLPAGSARAHIYEGSGEWSV